MTPSAQLVMLALALQDAIAIAGRPGALAPAYRPARRDAVRFARQLYREYCAIEARAELQRLLSQAATRTTTTTPDTYRSHFASITPGNWTGD